MGVDPSAAERGRGDIIAAPAARRVEHVRGILRPRQVDAALRPAIRPGVAPARQSADRRRRSSRWSPRRGTRSCAPRRVALRPLPDRCPRASRLAAGRRRVRSAGGPACPPPATTRVGEREHVHGRRADEPRGEHGGGPRVEFGGRPVLLDPPSRSRMTWSAMLMASLWSWVTYTMVMPSVCCRPRISRASRAGAGHRDWRGARPSGRRVSRRRGRAPARRAAADRPRAGTACDEGARGARATPPPGRGASRAPRQAPCAREARRRCSRRPKDAGREHRTGRPWTRGAGRRQVGDVHAPDQDAAARGGLEARDQPERGGLAATRRPEEHEHPAGRSFEAHVVDGAGGAPPPAHVLDGDRRQSPSPRM